MGWQLVDIEIVERFTVGIFKKQIFKHDTHKDEPAESYITDMLPRSDTLHDLCKSVK